MEVTTIIELALATTMSTVAAVSVAYALRHVISSTAATSARWIGNRLKRSNPNATWQDAYAPHCKRCGYDLRASPNHCPECGEPVPAYERTIIHYLIKIGDGPPRSSS